MEGLMSVVVDRCGWVVHWCDLPPYVGRGGSW